MRRCNGVMSGSARSQPPALFEIGKFLIGLYIGKQGLESTYGAASSLVVVLIWVYYSAQIVLLGAGVSRILKPGLAGRVGKPAGELQVQ